MRATIKDVAKLAGVSSATVSLVLNKRPAAIAEKTRLIVEEAAETLKYRPNQLAVGLVTKKTNVIGLIIPDNSNYFHAEYSTRVEQIVSEYGYTLIFGIANKSCDKVIHYINDFSDRGVDGIIVAQSIFANPDDTARCLEVINATRVPIVLTDRVPECANTDSIVLDDVEGGYIAVKHLLDLGHTNIGFVTGPLYYRNCTDRILGAKKAFCEAGLTFDESLVFEGDFWLTSGIKALPYLLGKGVSAIFAFNDMTAFGIYKELHNYNLKIPDDISIVGFDDIIFSDLLQPPLTTIEYPFTQMSVEVVKRLLDLINGEDIGDKPRRITFSPLLKVKGSTRRFNPQNGR